MKKTPPKLLTCLFPSFGNVVWVVSFFAVLLIGCKMMNGDGDLGRHLTIGNYILDNWKIPLQDLFSHTMAGQSLTPHEWLSQVFFALVHRISGFNGIVFLCALVIATSFWLVYKRARLTSQSILFALLITLLAITTSALHWLTRPHIFTFLLLAIWLFVLEQIRLGKPGRWWLLPIIMIFWANLHGAFIAGFVTWFIYGAGLGWDLLRQSAPEREPLPDHFWRDFLLGGAASFLASFVNPSGIALWKTSIGYVGTKYLVDMTNEYQAPNFHLASTWPFVFFIILLLIVLAYSRKKINSAHLFTSAAWAAMSLYSARNIPLFAIAAAPLLTGGLYDFTENIATRFKIARRFLDLDSRVREMDKKFKGWIWPVLCVAIVITGFATGFQFGLDYKGYGFDPEVFPVEAVDWLKENPQEGNVFNYFSWGGYLLYREWPERLVFIDGQTDFYGEALSREYMRVIQSQGDWEAVLNKYDVSWALLPVNETSVQMLQLELGWDIIFKDETAVILHK